MAEKRVRIYMVDDQAMVRAGLRSFLGSQSEFEVVGDSGDVREALEQLPGLKPDVVILDITMPGLSGFDAIPTVRKLLPCAKIIMLSNHEAEAFVQQALECGADGYLSKGSDPAELAVAILAVHRGDAYVSPRVSSGLVRGYRNGGADTPPARTRLASLTPREREVFQLLAIGRSNKEVAIQLSLSLGTAKKHRENLQRKLACNSAAELAHLAIREGLQEA